MKKMTKGQIESLISEEIIQFEKNYMGRGPKEAKTHVFKDVVFVRLQGVLTPAEEQLSKNPEGADLIKRTGIQLLENGRPLLEKTMNEITGCRLKSMHTDISTKTGERVIVFVLEGHFPYFEET